MARSSESLSRIEQFREWRGVMSYVCTRAKDELLAYLSEESEGYFAPTEESCPILTLLKKSKKMVAYMTILQN